MVFPSIWITSPFFTFVPISVTVSPLTVTFPFAISSSAFLLEEYPLLAMTFCNLSIFITQMHYTGKRLRLKENNCHDKSEEDCKRI